ncbi:type II secretion system F family protein [Pistricoccus aurantiacus]|uniref:Type II secretion system F family protein n=1 Tax=Pistricoccus aurantiacus TaxID=1883414 RepID=A0A5B8SZQ2_9GAMM|nr:type II secretion system F family protein [Pistricoccus aurantiacus]QEA40283.1 type II secretion system F family protein [Pistricoccus aurantiacus]
MATRQTKASKEAKLYRWQWTGKGPAGRKVSGEVIAGARQEVVDELSGQNVMVKRVRKKGGLSGGGRVKARDVMLFARQMATMIRAGVPILQAFSVVAESLKKPAMVDLVRRMKNDVSAGASFSEALASHPRYFDKLFVSMVAAGEQAGALDNMLERIATYKEKTEALKARVKKALYYPVAVVLVGIGVTAVLLIKVVPQFESLFSGFGAELPAMTQMTIRMSEFAQHYWLWGLAGVVAVGIAFFQALKRSSAFRYRVHALALKLPVLGNILDKSAVSQYSRTLAITFAAGVPLVEALNTAAGAVGNNVYERAIHQIREDVANGQQLNFAMRLTERFPSLATQMVGIGEESGSLDAMLNRVADYFEEEVDNQVDALTSLLEPFIIVILGVLVGGLVVSMYLPIFELGSVV